MSEQELSFQVGDQVIHWVYGIGEIIRLDEKMLSGNTGSYYVVQIGTMTIWVPLNDSGEYSLRYLTPTEDFQKLFQILASPGEPLSEDRYMRKTQLSDRLKDGTIESLCRVVRDVVHFKHSNKINESDNAILERATTSLLNEWSAALSVPIQQAEHELKKLLNATML